MEKNAQKQLSLMSKTQMWGGFFLTLQPSLMQKLVSVAPSEKVLQMARPFYSGT